MGRFRRQSWRVLLVTALAVSARSARAQAESYAYVCHPATDSVSVVDVSTNAIVATFAVGTTPSGIAVSPHGSLVYVANFGEDTVSVVDGSTVTATLPVGSCPQGLAVTPDGNWLFVANTADSVVSIIDTSVPSVVGTIPVAYGPRGAIASADGKTVYVSMFSRQVYVIDVATRSVVGTIPVGRNPWGMALHPSGSPLYVVNNDDSTVSVVDLIGGAPTATIPVGVGPHTVVLTSDGARAYVDNQAEATVSVIDTALDRVIGTIGVGRLPFGIDITPDGKKLYVTNGDLPAGSISVIDTATDVVTATIPSAQAASFGRFITSAVPECTFAPAGAPCAEDGNPCTRDTCDGNGVCAHDGAPRAACDPAVDSSIRLAHDASDRTADQLRVTFRGATAREQDAFGDPAHGTDETLCLYYDASLVATHTVPSDPVRWRNTPRGRGWRYVSRDLLGSDGITKLTMTAGTVGKPRTTRIAVKGSGAALPDRVLPLPEGVTAVSWQLINSANASCFGDRYAAPFARNSVDGTGAKARLVARSSATGQTAADPPSHRTVR